MMNLDAKDEAILRASAVARARIKGPRVGDFLLFMTGELERFSHDWGDGLQTAKGGSFFLNRSGHASFSGALNPYIEVESLKPTKAIVQGSFWFFHHGIPGAGRGVHCELDCRVYLTSARYQGEDGEATEVQYAQRKQIIDQLETVPESLRSYDHASLSGDTSQEGESSLNSNGVRK